MSSTRAIVPEALSAYKLEHSWLAHMLLVGMGVIVLALSARLEFFIPGTMIPVTGQTFAVLVIGATFGAWRATLTTLAYLASGSLGLPVFAAGAFAWATYGYLFGFVLAAALMGFCSERGWSQTFRSAWPLFFVGHTAIFICGVSWLALSIGWQKAVLTGFVPFIPGEMIKTTLAAALVPSLNKYLRA